MSGRVWLITGCSAGFGREIALAALAAGDRVMATARRPATLASLESAGGERLRTAALDVTDQSTVDAAVAATLDAFGRIDVLVNNAGNGSVGAVEEFTMAELRELMEVMFFGAVATTKAVLPHLREQRSGAVVMISSMGGQVTQPGFGAYCSAKFALEGLADSLADEVAPFGIKVMIVEPGAFRTEFGGSRMHRSAVIAEYSASTAGTRGAVEEMDQTQPGDPVKAAAAIVAALSAGRSPRRLVLGNDAVDGIRSRHQALAAELDEWEEVSRSTDIG